jgi:SNF2 family DNA or RNA helicase
MLDFNLSVILAATFKAVILRLRITDTFNGKPVANYKPRKEETVTHAITLTQRAAQMTVRHNWDTEYKGQMEQRQTGTCSNPKQILSAIQMAGLSIVHPDRAKAGYGEPTDNSDAAEPSVLAKQPMPFEATALTEESKPTSQEEDADGPETETQTHTRRHMFRDMISQNENWRSPRMLLLLDIVDHHLLHSEGKNLIFSEFLCVLDVVEIALASKKYGCLRYDGSVSLSDRNDNIRHFTSNPDENHILLTIDRCGDYGLNLPIAKLVIHVTPCWNPSMNQRCNGRAVRPGQTGEVTIKNLYYDDSIERHVMSLADTKKKKSSTILDPTKQVTDQISQSRLWSKQHFVELVCITNCFLSSTNDF